MEGSGQEKEEQSFQIFASAPLQKSEAAPNITDASRPGVMSRTAGKTA